MSANDKNAVEILISTNVDSCLVVSQLTTIWKIRLNCEDKQVHIYQQREHLPIDIWR
jgi:hypothetical protein